MLPVAYTLSAPIMICRFCARRRSLRSFFALEAEGGAAAVDKLRRLDAQIAANFAGHTHAATISCLTATGSSRPLLVSIVWLGEVSAPNAVCVPVCAGSAPECILLSTRARFCR